MGRRGCLSIPRLTTGTLTTNTHVMRLAFVAFVAILASGCSLSRQPERAPGAPPTTVAAGANVRLDTLAERYYDALLDYDIASGLTGEPTAPRDTA